MQTISCIINMTL